LLATLVRELFTDCFASLLRNEFDNFFLSLPNGERPNHSFFNGIFIFLRSLIISRAISLHLLFLYFSFHYLIQPLLRTRLHNDHWLYRKKAAFRDSAERGFLKTGTAGDGSLLLFVTL
jgi:hypothetical protein